MDKVIVTGLLVIGAVTAAVLVVASMAPSISESSQSVAKAQKEVGDRIGTSIEIIAVAPNSAGTKIDAWVKNVGAETISAIEKSDVFLFKLDGTWGDALTYNNDGVTTKTWLGDLEESGLPWNRADTLQITVTLVGGDILTAGDNYLLKVSTPNGITAEHTFNR